MSTEVIKSTPKRGDKCANGAIILDIKRTFGDAWIVLCLWADESPYHPFVTWLAFWSETGELRTLQGHYHDELSQAIIDFAGRS